MSTNRGKRTTIYRLTGVNHLREAIREKYLKSADFTNQELVVAGRPALLVSGAMRKDTVDWCSDVQSLTGRKLNIPSITPAGVLILKHTPAVTDPEDSPPSSGNNVAFVLSYGMGFQLLDPNRIDNLFGQRIAIRTANPDMLRSLTVTTMDERSKTSRATIPQGTGLLGFGVGELGEAVSRIVANAEIPTLSHSQGESLQIRGSDALNIPVAISAEEVIADLDELERILKAEPLPGLKLLEQLSEVKNPETKEQLDNTLSTALESFTQSIGLSWPYERINENGTPDSWKPRSMYTRGNNKVRDGVPDWSDVKSALGSWPKEDRLERLKKASIQVCRDSGGEEPISQAIPLIKWVGFETEIGKHTYSLYDGRWYQVHHDYAERITKQTAAIFEKELGDLQLPTWSDDKDEAQYNKKMAKALGGFCLDRKLITTDLHRRGIEACDVFLPDGTFIHVKNTDRSTAASHLLAQALISTDALCLDEQARAKLRTKITQLGGDANSLGVKPARVVLAMHRKTGKPINAEELFTFTKVNLVRQVNSLESRGVPVYIVTIEKS